MRSSISVATWQQIKTAYAAGIGLREIARNMGMSENTVLARARRERWAQQVADAKARVPSHSDALTAMDGVATTMLQRGQRHVERMADVTEKVLPHLESMEPGAILEGIHEVEKFDRMARRNFGLGDGSPAGNLNVQVLANQALVTVARS